MIAQDAASRAIMSSELLSKEEEPSRNPGKLPARKNAWDEEEPQTSIVSTSKGGKFAVLTDSCLMSKYQMIFPLWKVPQLDMFMKQMKLGKGIILCQSLMNF
jgi:hypothetical protein